MNEAVLTLAVYNGELIAGGWFITQNADCAAE
jgi:hypothetical protein